MKKFSNKVMAIVGATALAVGFMAFPVLAGTDRQQGNGWVGQMQGFMQNTFTPGQHQTLMNSTAMQNHANSSGMQNAMKTGDVKAMQELMNSDPSINGQIGKENLDKMNQFISNSSGNMMASGKGVMGSRVTMMPGIARE